MVVLCRKINGCDRHMATMPINVTFCTQGFKAKGGHSISVPTRVYKILFSVSAIIH